MQMSRRVEKLEAVLPDNAPSYRVLFKNEGAPDPMIDPPLQPNEQALMVVFASPGRWLG